jgi:hypothetical protein
MAKGFEKRLTDVAKEPGDAAIRQEIKARIDGVTAGVGDVLESMASDVRARMDALGAQMKEIQAGMTSIAQRFSEDRVVALDRKKSEPVGSDDA